MFVGVSGGGDSIALLLQLVPVAAAQGRALVAGVIDHALRPGSGGDAERAAAIARDLGAAVRIHRLDWPEGPRPAQAPARAARYAALADLARAIGARTLFLGHTADDQAETVFLRQAAGSGPRGLAGMAPLAPCPIWPAGRDLRLARPLLDVSRADLRHFLRARGVGWIEDPANALVRYARVRARAALAEGGGPALVASAADHAAAAAAEDRAAIQWLGDADLADDEARLPAIDLGSAAQLRALAALLTAYGGAIREPSARAVARLAAQGGGTLSGALVRGDRVGRDPGGIFGRRGGAQPLAPVRLPAGETIVWDNRLALMAASDAVAMPPAVGAPWPGEPGRRMPHWTATGRVEAQWLPAGRVRNLLFRGA